MQQTDVMQTDRQTDVRKQHRLMPPPIRGGGIIKLTEQLVGLFYRVPGRAMESFIFMRRKF